MNRESKIVYCFDEETKAFAGTEWAFESPLEKGVFHIPANSTLIEIPPPDSLKENETFVFNIESQSWQIVPDFSQEVWIDPEKGEAVRLEVGQPLPQNLVRLSSAKTTK